MRTLIGQTVSKAGQTVTIQGWVDTRRDHGKLVFTDIRDRSGIVQVIFTPSAPAYEKAQTLRGEWVVSVTGTVKERPAGMVNQNIPTGAVEIEAQELEILNESQTPPFPIDAPGYDVDENVRLKYRYLDLRRPRLQKSLRLRSRFYAALREALLKRDFVEIETPMLTKSTKEGARDFIVPSRFHPGKFYALPQSPQQYKQLLMTAGFERYFQFARCIRDEDLRADRGFEFTQLDMEMSFATQEDVMGTVEQMVKESLAPFNVTLAADPFPVFTYEQAMERFGADKFDMRSEEEKKAGVFAFAWVVKFPFFKQVDKADVAEVRDGKSGWTFTHNPFSAPVPEHTTWHLEGKNIAQILTSQYDLVCNGYEVGGGSIRAHDPAVLAATLKIMGYTPQQLEESVGHMITAFGLGTPPHGGIALGLDRLVMLLAQESSLREVIAFPMTSTGQTAVMDAPAPVGKDQLDELHIKVIEPKK